MNEPDPTEGIVKHLCRGIIAALWFSLASTAVLACPFCPPSSPPLSEQLAESDCAIRATWVRIIPAKTEGDSPQTVFKITDVERDRSGKLKPGDLITVDFERSGNPNETLFLSGKLDQEFMQWGQPLKVTEESFAYIRALPSPEEPTGKRLRFFLKFLEYDELLISNDAFSEFARAKYEDVVAMQDTLPRDKLRKWLRSPDTDPVRLGFYGMLLGLCGDQTDAEYLWDRFAPPPGPNEVRISIDGMMGGYLLLTGETGLLRLIDTKLRPPNAADADVNAVINALRYVWQYAPHRVPRAKTELAMQFVLQRHQFAELVIPDLSRWKAWDATEAVLAWMGQEPFDQPTKQTLLVQFARECVKDAKTTGNEKSAPAELAQTFLDRLQREQPETWEKIDRILSPRKRDKAATDLFDASK